MVNRNNPLEVTSKKLAHVPVWSRNKKNWWLDINIVYFDNNSQINLIYFEN